MEELRFLLRSTTVGKLIERNKRKLICVQHTATLGEVLQIMQKHDISTVPVAAPALTEPQLTKEEKLELVASCKHFFGIISLLDIVLYLVVHDSTDKSNHCQSQLLDTPAHSILNNCGKGRWLSVMSPETSVLEAMDMMVNGVKQALVACKSLSSTEQTKPGLDDRKESLAAGYCMITQRDILQFIQTEREKFKPVLSKSVESLGIYEERVLGVSRSLPLVDTLRCMQQNLSTIVPIVDHREKMEHFAKGQLVDVKGELIAGSLSVSDLKGCPLEALCTWANREVLVFLKRAYVMTLSGITVDDINAHEDGAFQMDQVCESFQFEVLTCTVKDLLGDVIEMVLNEHGQQVWVVEKDAILVGCISFSNIFQALKRTIS
ncbi:hypothetical protein L7F22_061484 [Adiantum nelumboides]|nr:hypothetical protein [Adiantum nelumboides]